jgi:HlyD family secretion protein
MPATFTVDAFPNQVFHGQVGKVRLNATMTQNVVTYTVEVITDNSDGKLLPYLTANAQFITARRDNVLTVPNAALNWRPRPEQIAPEFRQAARASKSSKHQPAGGDAGESPGQRPGTVWVEEGDYLKPIKVSVGLTDGTQTEVQAPELSEGLPVVIGEQSPQTSAGGPAPGASPFTPQLGRARGNAAQGGGAGAGSPPGAAR